MMSVPLAILLETLVAAGFLAGLGEESGLLPMSSSLKSERNPTVRPELNFSGGGEAATECDLSIVELYERDIVDLLSSSSNSTLVGLCIISLSLNLGMKKITTQNDQNLNVVPGKVSTIIFALSLFA